MSKLSENFDTLGYNILGLNNVCYSDGFESDSCKPGCSGGCKPGCSGGCKNTDKNGG